MFEKATRLFMGENHPGHLAITPELNPDAEDFIVPLETRSGLPNESVEPCGQAEKGNNPCEIRDVSGFNISGPQTSSEIHLTQIIAPSVEAVLTAGHELKNASPVYLVMRGTAPPESIRCALRPTARTPEQR